MKIIKKYSPLFTFLLITLFGSFKKPIKDESYTLKVDVNGLRNSNGRVVFALYNREDAFPDEHYQKYFVKTTGKILNGTSAVQFDNIPKGTYAVNILHDEDANGKIKKGFILPKEGIGFSNYQSINITNRPKFSKASFNLDENKKISVKIIYL